MFSRLICLFKSHDFIPAGKCPFTGSTYDYCRRCKAMVPRELAE